MLKADKPFYQPGTRPVEILVPPMIFFELDGAGRPDAPEFAEVIGTLYSLAYTVRMAPRNGLVLPAFQEFTVYPLEGIWDLSQTGQRSADPAAFGILDKSQLVYRMMIRQPEFVTSSLFPEILAFAARKKPQPLLDHVKLTRLEEGHCVQMMHIGSYDSEPASFVQMQAYCEAHGLQRRGHTHREIYMSDPRRVAPDATKTVLRWLVEKI